MEYSYLKTSQEGPTLWVELCNPHVNFLTVDMLEELFYLVSEVRCDDSIRVLVLTGGIEDTYIMHFSIPELQRIAEESRTSPLARLSVSHPGRFVLENAVTLGMLLMDRFPLIERKALQLAKGRCDREFSYFLWLQMHRLYLAVERLNKVTIAAINGPCNGGGTELTACFDFRFMVGDQGFKIGQPEVLINIIPGGGSSQRLPRLIGKARALEWMLHGNQLEPLEAKRIGLLTGVFDKAEFRPGVQEFAELMAKRPPVAVDALKQAVNRGADTSLVRGLSLELLQSMRCLGTSDTQRAMKAYAGLLEERVDVPPEERISQEELMDIMLNARYLDGFDGR